MTKGALITIGSEDRAGGDTPHAVYGASSASIWMNCHGMFNLLNNARKSGAVPERDGGSRYAHEGTLAHEAGEKVIIGWLKGQNINIEVPDEIEDVADFKAAVQEYLDAVAPVLRDGGEWFGVEVQVDLNELYERNDFLLAGPHQVEAFKRSAPLFGTADFVALRGSKLFVMDYKHGAGVPVDAIGNPQLKYYALGAMLRAEAEGLGPVEDIEVTIVQPRAPGPSIKPASYKRAELLEFGMDLVASVVATTKDDAKLKAGKWCQFCKAAPAPCPKLAERAREIAKNHFTAIGPDAEPIEQPQALDADELAKALDELPVLQEWIKNVQRAATGRITRGETIKGYKAVRARSNRRWDDEVAVLDKVLADDTAVVDAIAPRRVLSVAQMEKAAKAGVAADPRVLTEILSEHTIRPDGAITYAPESDPRPAETPAKDSFDALE